MQQTEPGFANHPVYVRLPGRRWVAATINHHTIGQLQRDCSEMEKRGRKSGARLTREDWLKQALAVLSKKGQAGMGIEMLSAAIGVSRGSFYWHFENRSDFVRALLQHWFENYTLSVPDLVNHDGGSAEERLARLFDVIHGQKMTKYDVAIRSWALHDRDVDQRVAETDRYRLAFIKGLFSEMGFVENELEIRARSCLSFLTLEHSVFDKLDQMHRADLIDTLLEFLIRK